jgi:hypothetical protein
LFYTHMTLQHAMRQAGRFAATGNRMEDPDHPGTDLSRVNSIILVARQAAAGIDVSNIQISSAQGGSSGPGRAGGPGDTVTISLTTTMRLLTPLIGRFFGQTQSYPIEVQATFRNEPFPPNQTSW